ncbi:hypothetical protein EN836_27935 [Mesorhizobium sp. M1C.F.Ca.ET.193.01.1.1]|nr:MAG: hypothetical protein EOQ57_31350 [Mesorhizobium sp.]TGQ65881.1 hypothetical protein EN855_027940 [Mesorhizobium sp. M1C.F.Ca.ET.212.01.1.1]TGR43094.1 hypothetical protein EN838_27930 [Mesorhizobium sp. M1C.F.Ca.ET.195.01.1.1]TGR74800.1 hypothetical protein EN832_27945 [Mesorhizobium sp. M1C.F.Ca.ET.189.01.1.1]TGR77371.1 hypothetical protein EN836_27935 [Mesorhizobium sp. M1C.F.Ca.ET.193.01.1.1]TGU73710.1 hypothetical protein EN787_27995 [Mesorhizobium sp. M1C.F.Ca.ET.144.01.1.1]
MAIDTGTSRIGPSSRTMPGDRREKLAELLRRQFASEAVRRHLRGLPIFRVEQWLPEQLRALLDRLAKKEDGRPR